MSAPVADDVREVQTPGGGTGERTERWLRAQLAQLTREAPARARLVVLVAQHPAAVLVPLGVVVGVLGGLSRTDGDQVHFRRAGLQMLGPGVLDVFSDSWLQIGPLYLLALGVVTCVGGLLGLSDLAVGVLAAAAHGAAVAALTVTVVRRAAELAGRRGLLARWVVGLVVVVGDLMFQALEADHAEELMLGMLLTWAAVEVARGARSRAVLLVVLAGGIKQWALTCAGVLLYRVSLPRAVSVTLATAAGTVLVYGPFVLWGEVATFSMRWPFPDHAWHLHVPGLRDLSDWTFRLVQGGAAGVAGVLVARRRYGSPVLAVFVAIAVRMLLDPLRLTYYWGGLAAVLLVWLWTSPAVSAWVVAWRARPALTLVPVLVAQLPMGPVTPWVLPGTVLLLLLPVWALAVEARHARTAAAVPAGTAPAASTGRDASAPSRAA